MAVEIQEPVLEAGLEKLESARAWSPRVVSRFEALLRTEDETAVYRMNPLAFAKARGLGEQEAIDLFLHATRAGLVTLDWALICPKCGDPVRSFQSLRAVQDRYRCGLCQVETRARLDDFIQVSFTVAPGVRDLSLLHPERLSAEEYVSKCRFVVPGRLRGTDFTFRDLMRVSMRAAFYVPPGETREAVVAIGPGNAIGFKEMFGEHSEFAYAAPSPDVAAVEVEATLTRDGIRVKGSFLAGEVRVRVVNEAGMRACFLVADMPFEATQGSEDLDFDPFLTGARLLANHTFRRLFGAETLAASGGIGVRGTTILFTDLKSSTALYDRIGDLNAFALVRQHFERLGEVVEKHDGAVVKTIGDAVMATFSTPVSAVRAGLAMIDAIEAFNHEHGSRELALKVGVHHGAAIVVTLNDRLDYFGQTVNVAARVQALADADEVVLSEDVFRAPEVRDALGGRTANEEVAQLKGVAGDVRVYRVAALMA